MLTIIKIGKIGTTNIFEIKPNKFIFFIKISIAGAVNKLAQNVGSI